MSMDGSTSSLALKVVSATFVVAGILAAIQTLFAATDGLVSVNLGLLGIPVGIGLLRHAPVWRVLGLVLACLNALCMFLLGAVWLATDQPVSYSGLGQTGTLPPVVVAVFALLALVVSAWQHWVLTRPRVKQLFISAGNAA